MSIVNSLKRLKSNIFGGPGNTGFEKPPAYKTRINMDTPTGILDHDPFQFGTYQYPRDIVENGQLGHYMIFYINVMNATSYSYGEYDGEVKAIQKTQAGINKVVEQDQGLAKAANLKRDVINIEGENMSTQQAIKKAARKAGVESRNYDSAGDDLFFSQRNVASRTGIATKARFKGTTRRISDSIALYLPANVQDNTTATYQDTPTGMAGFAAATGMDFIRALENRDFEAAGKLFAEGGGQFALEATKRAGAAIAEGLTGSEGIIGMANRLFGQADNPFMEVLFESMAMRQFQYNFNFAPRNREETEDVQKIINLFRFHMAPELQGANSRYLTLPSEFDIHYMYHHSNGVGIENDYFNRISTCVLENVSTNYTPGEKVRTFQDGAPTQITMTLQFKETELLTKEKIAMGY